VIFHIFNCKIVFVKHKCIAGKIKIKCRCFSSFEITITRSAEVTSIPGGGGAPDKKGRGGPAPPLGGEIWGFWSRLGGWGKNFFFSWQKHKRRGREKTSTRGGGGDSDMKWTGMLDPSLRGVNFGFWSRLGCSGQNVILFSRQGLV